MVMEYAIYTRETLSGSVNGYNLQTDATAGQAINSSGVIVDGVNNADCAEEPSPCGRPVVLGPPGSASAEQATFRMTHVSADMDAMGAMPAMVPRHSTGSCGPSVEVSDGIGSGLPSRILNSLGSHPGVTGASVEAATARMMNGLGRAPADGPADALSATRSVSQLQAMGIQLGGGASLGSTVATAGASAQGADASCTHVLAELCAQQAVRLADLEQELMRVQDSDSRLEQELREARAHSERERLECSRKLEQMARLQAQLQTENEELFTELERAAQRIEALKHEVVVLQGRAVQVENSARANEDKLRRSWSPSVQQGVERPLRKSASAALPAVMVQAGQVPGQPSSAPGSTGQRPGMPASLMRGHSLTLVNASNVSGPTFSPGVPLTVRSATGVPHRSTSVLGVAARSVSPPQARPGGVSAVAVAGSSITSSAGGPLGCHSPSTAQGSPAVLHHRTSVSPAPSAVGRIRVQSASPPPGERPKVYLCAEPVISARGGASLSPGRALLRDRPPATTLPGASATTTAAAGSPGCPVLWDVPRVVSVRPSMDDLSRGILPVSAQLPEGPEVPRV